MKLKHKIMAIKMGTKIKNISCIKKRAFCKIEAEELAFLYKQRAYECRFCLKYHLTTNI